MTRSVPRIIIPRILRLIPPFLPVPNLRQLLLCPVGILLELSTTTPPMPSIPGIDVVGHASHFHHVALAILHPVPHAVDGVVLVVDPTAAAPEYRQAAASHLYRCAVVLAHETRHPLHAPVDDGLDVGRAERPEPVPRYLVIYLQRGESHDLIPPHAGIPDDPEMTEGQAFEAGFEEIERAAKRVGDGRFARAVDLVIRPVVARKSWWGGEM